MLQRLIAYSLMIIAVATYPTHVHAFELQMDGQLSENTVIAVDSSLQPISTKPTPQPINPPIFNTIQSSSSLQLWWLFAFPVLFLLMGFGWILGLYMEKRTRIDKKTCPSQSLTSKHAKKIRPNIHLPKHLICWMFTKPTVVFYLSVIKKC